MPLRSSADSSTFSPLLPTPTVSRICTTCPEKPHCGNCGVPFMNSTTSFDFTSLSMNCSMLIFASFCGMSFEGRQPVNTTVMYVLQTVVHPKQNGGELACRASAPDGPIHLIAPDGHGISLRVVSQGGFFPGW